MQDMMLCSTSYCSIVQVLGSVREAKPKQVASEVLQR